MDVTGNGAFVLAAAALPVGVAAALSGLYPLMTMALARWCCATRCRRWAWLRWGCAVAGHRAHLRGLNVGAAG